MKPAQIFHQYIWIINTLRAYRGLTLEELNQKWIVDGVADGNPLQPKHAWFCSRLHCLCTQNQ